MIHIVSRSLVILLPPSSTPSAAENTVFTTSTMSISRSNDLSLPFHLVEITLISAQDLAAISRSPMRTYAIIYMDRSRKLTTRVDSDGHTNPSWNDRFIFRVDNDFLLSDNSSLTIEIHAVRLLGHAPIGIVRILISTLFPSLHPAATPARFVALQVHRPSGRPQGILTVGVALLNPLMRSMPLYATNDPNEMTVAIPHHPQPLPPEQPKLRRIKSECRSDIADSEMGPPPSTTGNGDDYCATEVESSIMEDWSVASSGGGKELLRMKLEKWRTELPPIYDRGNRKLKIHRPISPSQERQRHCRQHQQRWFVFVLWSVWMRMFNFLWFKSK